MFDCNSLTLNGLDVGCGDGIGGIKEVYISLYDDISTITVDEATAVIQMVSNKKFKPYRFRRATGSLTSTLNVDDVAGTSYVQSDLVLQFNKYADSATRLEIQALSMGKLAVIVKTNDNNYVFLGSDNYVSCTSGSGQTGQAYADGSFYTITLTDYSHYYPVEITESNVKNIVSL